MRNRTHPNEPGLPSRGMALVLVLAILVLVTALVVGFFHRASVERSSANSYFENNRLGMLADQAVRIVQNQIDHASTRPATAWATQPGMARTFNQDGTLKQAYKLYSDHEMVAASADLGEAHDDLWNWAAQPAIYSDLNAPVDGVHPILDPGARDEIEGFAVDETRTPSVADNPLPMPVRWLYLLEDGSVVAPESEAGGTRARVAGASAENPIVGRLAFWTDDESSKLNINTASHGSFWDIPRAFSYEERDRMARFQPAAREFQRYPGHPATISLAPAFGHLFGFPGNFDEAAFSDFVFRLTPRLQAGGSAMGTVVPVGPISLDHNRLFSSLDEVLFDPDRNALALPSGGRLGPRDIERMRFFLTARSNAPEVNLFNLPRLAVWPVNGGTKAPGAIDELMAFCATINGQPYYLQRQDANSSGGDFSAFGGRNASLHAYLNRLLALPPPGFGPASFAQKYSPEECAQIVTQIFDYIRASNLHSTAFGAHPYTDGTGLGYAPKINDPSDLFPPAISGSGVGQVVPLKVGNTKGFGRIPIISRAVFQLFVSGARMPVVDSGANPVAGPGGQPLENEFVPVRRGGTGGNIYATPRLDYNPGDSAIEGETLYARWKRFLDGKAPYVTEPNRHHGNTAKLLTSGIIYFDTFDPMYGYATPRYNFDIRVRFSGPWTVDGQALNFPDSTLHIRRDHALVYDARSDGLQPIWQGRHLGGPLLPQWLMQNYSSLRANPPDPNDQVKNGGLAYPLVSDRLAIHPPITLVDSGTGGAPADRNFPEYSVVEAAMGNLNFSGGTILVELLVGAEVVQTYEFEFPAFSKPKPGYGVPEIATTTIPLLKQMPVSFDFRHRWLAEPRKHRVMDSSADYLYPDLRLVQGRDVAVSLVPALGDKRLLAAKAALGPGDFRTHELYGSSSARAAVDFRDDPVNVTVSRNRGTVAASRLLEVGYGRNALPDIPSHLQPGVQQGLGLAFPPDFDNGTYQMPDDAYVNRADESSAKDTMASTGDVRNTAWYQDSANVSETVYRNFRDNETFYSPNRQMPSAVMFGSLPTGVVRNRPWQTLLFRPDPGRHPGAANPPDFTMLDLFWMPVVEPYAISEPFSTCGKVNMNYQIMPFGRYLTRSTALHGVLRNEEMTVFENAHASDAGGGDEYKKVAGGMSSALSSLKFRRKIDAEETLKGFQAVFDEGRVFRSETEICVLPLVPEGETYSENFEETFWNPRRLTGDNSRERPYAHLLPKLTTRSNTFTVHFLVQTLKNGPMSPGVWEEKPDAVTAESRGSRVIERYIEPQGAAASSIPDYAASPSPVAGQSLDQFYRWRVISDQKFPP